MQGLESAVVMHTVWCIKYFVHVHTHIQLRIIILVARVFVVCSIVSRQSHSALPRLHNRILFFFLSLLYLFFYTIWKFLTSTVVTAANKTFYPPSPPLSSYSRRLGLTTDFTYYYIYCFRYLSVSISVSLNFSLVSISEYSYRNYSVRILPNGRRTMDRRKVWKLHVKISLIYTSTWCLRHNM